MRILFLYASLLWLASPALAEPPAYQPQAGKMSHCPNSVTGAETAVTNTPSGVEMTITASSQAATADIRARARHLASVAKAGAPRGTPDRNGHGGGVHGHCPVVIKDARVSVAEIERGVKLSIEARDQTKVAALQKTVAERRAGLQPPK